MGRAFKLGVIATSFVVLIASVGLVLWGAWLALFAAIPAGIALASSISQYRKERDQ